MVPAAAAAETAVGAAWGGGWAAAVGTPEALAPDGGGGAENRAWENIL